MTMIPVKIPSIGEITEESGMRVLELCSDGFFRIGKGGVKSITATGDGKVEFVAFEDHTLAYINSSMGYPAYYPVHPVAIKKPVKAVLMDLDGTSVHSEEFWIWIIQLSIARLIDNPKFEFEEADLPFISGHSVSEHLQYCIEKYCPDKTVEEARKYYFEFTCFQMNEIRQGRGRDNAFVPAPGLKEFLLELKAMGIKIGLVTSGLYEKAWPEILSAFRTLDMGDPTEFYDAIITAGFQPGHGKSGTLGELEAKPHPWLYAEAARVGLAMQFADRNSVIGLEDSGAGVCAIRLAGFPVIGLANGNIIESGTKELCSGFCKSLEEVLSLLLKFTDCRS